MTWSRPWLLWSITHQLLCTLTSMHFRYTSIHVGSHIGWTSPAKRAQLQTSQTVLSAWTIPETWDTSAELTYRYQYRPHYVTLTFYSILYYEKNKNRLETCCIITRSSTTTYDTLIRSFWFLILLVNANCFCADDHNL